MEYCEIKEIVFGVFSSEFIKRNGVCEVKNSNLSGPESVYDERMGVIENGKTCSSCGNINKNCPGHFGYIKMPVPLYHPMYFRNIVTYMNIFCSECSRLYVTKEHLEIEGLVKKFDKIVDFVTTVDSCSHCNAKKCKYIYNTTDKIVQKCSNSKTVSLREDISSDFCLSVFNNIIKQDLDLLNLDVENTHPRNLIIEYLPVIPTRARPYVIQDGNICDDDITIVYQTILKLSANFTPEKTQSLMFQLSTLMNNSDGKSKHSNGGRPIKGIKERISGKDGIIRNNMSGKRVNQSARTVIGPDPTLKTDEVALPKQIAKNLTIQERVSRFNINKLQNIVNNGCANYVLRDKFKINLEYACNSLPTEVLPGDIVTRNGKVITTTNYKEGDIINRNGTMINYIPSTKKFYKLKDGDIVERQVTDGDTILINRQPTLHKCSMLAKKVVVREGKTLRLNLATTKVFNADFDGDEMNVHVPQDYNTISELDTIASTRNNIISAQSSKPNISIVQDGMLGAYLMTKNDYTIPKHIFMDMCMSITYDYERFEPVVSKLGYIGKSLVSLILPDNFMFKSDDLVIEHGILVSGAITKGIMGKLITIINKEYPNVLDFVNNIQFLANVWLQHFGFSIGIGDCIPPKQLEETIQKNVTKCFTEAQMSCNTITNQKIKNAKISMALSKAKDTGMKAAKDSFTSSNGFVSTVTSGSKGDYFNVCQITGLLGQQNVSGKRIEPVLNNCTRTLPHYPKTTNDEENFESRGFVRNSFIRGLKPQEFFFHSMSGREGVSDTALKTWVSGYTQRKMIKILEDIQVKYDGTVRNSANEIIQWQYANDGLDRTRTIPNNGHTDFCDISRLVDKLNIEFEESLKL